MSYIYLVSVGSAANAHIRFSYWAEFKITNEGYMGMALGGVVFMTLIMLVIFVVVTAKTVNREVEVTEN